MNRARNKLDTILYEADKTEFNVQFMNQPLKLKIFSFIVHGLDPVASSTSEKIWKILKF